jgi:carboxyl-terminal processing protease
MTMTTGIETEAMKRARLLAAAVCIASMGLAACGGGGGGGTPAPPPVVGPPPPPPPVGPSWTPGVFAAASTFKDRCEVPRTGNDLFGRPFPDRAGTALEERFWLRSWTHETYLWNTEVQDQNPANYATRRLYFAVLKTNAQTPSGKDKDDFHFSESTEAYQRRQNSAPSATYGADYVFKASTPPRDVRVGYTEPLSPAAAVTDGQAAFVRGSRLLRINGIDVVNANTQAEVDQLNAALFPAAANTSTTFVVRDPGATTDRTVTLTSINLSPSPVNRTRIIDTPTGKVGYILFNTFSPFESERAIIQAMTEMRINSVTDLVLDLRYNGGGLLAVSSQLAYMVAGASRTENRAFSRLRFNAAAGAINPVTGQTNSPTPFYNQTIGFGNILSPNTALPTLTLNRVFVLTTAETCSASEAVINGLRGINFEVNIIGAKTCGKPFGFYPQDNCGETYYTIQFQTTNDQSFGDYADGFIPNNSTAPFGIRAPGCQVADDLSRELGDPAEGLLAAALQFRANGSCPAPTSGAAPEDTERASGAAGLPLLPPERDLMETNYDMTLPPGFRGTR